MQYAVQDKKNLTERKADLSENILPDNKVLFSELYDKYAPGLLHMISYRINDPESAETILQKVFLIIWDEMKKENTSNFPQLSEILKITRTCLDEATGLKEQRVHSEIHPVHNFVYKEAEYVNASQLQKENSEENPLLKRNERNLALDLVYFKSNSILEAAKEIGTTTEELKKRMRTEIKKYKEGQSK